MNTQVRYTPTAIWLHWIMAVLILGLILMGIYMSELPESPDKFALYDFHKAIGMLALLLIFARLAWRWTHQPPALPQRVSATTRKAAAAGQALLYLCMVFAPLSGWLMSSAYGHPPSFFGIVTLPELVWKNESFAETLKGVHFALTNGLLFLAVGHVVLALKHHWINKDGLLNRLKPWAN
ncbi:MAG: cytochrome b [Sulfuricella denitrificans]|nr:cytochrome b [Sulfuricella denitrificans]